MLVKSACSLLNRNPERIKVNPKVTPKWLGQTDPKVTHNWLKTDSGSHFGAIFESLLSHFGSLWAGGPGSHFFSHFNSFWVSAELGARKEHVCSMLTHARSNEPSKKTSPLNSPGRLPKKLSERQALAELLLSPKKIVQLIPQTFFCCNFPVQNYRINSRIYFAVLYYLVSSRRVMRLQNYFLKLFFAPGIILVTIEFRLPK